MIYKITAGKRRPFPPFIGLQYNCRSMKRRVTFLGSCAYDLPGTNDDADINKLFGIGYIWHHQESARFGWNYNQQSKKITAFAYCYVNGILVYEPLVDLYMYHEYLFDIIVSRGKNNEYVFVIAHPEYPSVLYYEQRIAFDHSKKISYFLGPYFGGTFSAPHDIKIKIR